MVRRCRSLGFEEDTVSYYEIGSTQTARIAHFLLERIRKTPTHTRLSASSRELFPIKDHQDRSSFSTQSPSSTREPFSFYKASSSPITSLPSDPQPTNLIPNHTIKMVPSAPQKNTTNTTVNAPPFPSLTLPTQAPNQPPSQPQASIFLACLPCCPIQQRKTTTD